jgi:hypothetical protein
VKYSYQVGGQSYENDRLYAGPAVRGDAKPVMNKFLEQYPVGRQVEVFYNPQNPAESALYKQNPNLRGVILGLVVGDVVMCLILPLMWFLLGLTKWL